MAGGLMQLVAYGAQDVYLTGQPKVTFFQAVYKRHTNFAMEAILQTVNGSAANGARVSVTIARNGDLVGDMWLQLQPATGTAQSAQANLVSTNTTGDLNWVAERAVAAVELTIGGQRIDKHYRRGSVCTPRCSWASRTSTPTASCPPWPTRPTCPLA